MMFLSWMTRNLIRCLMFLVNLHFLLTTCLWLRRMWFVEMTGMNHFRCRSRIGIVAAQLIHRLDLLESVPSSLVVGKSRGACDSSIWLPWIVLVLMTVSCDIRPTQWHWGTFLSIHTLSMPISVVDTTPLLIESTSWWLAGLWYVYIDLWTLRQHIESCRGSRAICWNQGRNHMILHYWSQCWIRSRNRNLFYPCRY